jgi:hypothetical protein
VEGGGEEVEDPELLEPPAVGVAAQGNESEHVEAWDGCDRVEEEAKVVCGTIEGVEVYGDVGKRCVRGEVVGSTDERGKGEPERLERLTAGRRR